MRTVDFAGCNGFQRAALENYAPTQFGLAILLLKSTENQPDLREAMKWLTRGANQGFHPAEVNLGIVCGPGIGVTRELTCRTPDSRSGLDSLDYNA